jgi:hypothetical protein
MQIPARPCDGSRRNCTNRFLLPACRLLPEPLQRLPCATVPISGTPVNVMDGLQCSIGRFRQRLSRSTFRWPNCLVYAEDARGGLDSAYHLISYSPFPGSLTLNQIEEHWTSPPPASATHITTIERDPLAHFRRDLEVSGVHIGG